ncbi:hypothetical protein FA13DRAFT_1735777 [Coprinellus micaceus]|uniref:Uncharacterized protein n=1 Tax=Coprinellus micaceus TaxID=71717 RepID=A0A4Y7T3G4_COPMI|nr:hypothetical protein FA13DRAFT_1735777 [Coprinellus micaceus]
MPLEIACQDISPSPTCEFEESRVGRSHPNSLEDTGESVWVLRTDALASVESSHEGWPLNLEKAVEASRPHPLYEDPPSPGVPTPQTYSDSPLTMDDLHNWPEEVPRPSSTAPTLRRRRPHPAATSTSLPLALPSPSSPTSAFASTSPRTTISTVSSYLSATTTVSTSSGLSSRRPNNVAMIAGTLVAAIAIIASFIVVFLVGCRRHSRRRRYSTDSPSVDPESTAPCPTRNPSVSSLRLVPLNTHAGSLRPVRRSGSRSEGPRAAASDHPQPHHLSTDDPPEYDHIPHPPVAARVPGTAVK